MGVYKELPKEWAKWSFDVRDIHDNILEAKVTDLDLVRCGECKWFIGQGEGNVGKCKYRTRPILYCLPTDFCSYGERRNDDSNT